MTDNSTASHDEIRIQAGDVELDGYLTLPARASGVVAFAHGSGSSRFSPRNRQVAEFLNGRGLATLLFDLLTAGENREDQITRAYRFDIALLARRLEATVLWMDGRPELANLKIGLFGASTGAAAALIAAAARPHLIAAVVSRGGRPDLAEDALERVQSPTLLIVGGRDTEVLMLNKRAAARLDCPHEVTVVPGATHLFEETGALEAVCGLAADWFQRYLVATSRVAS